MGQYPVPQFIEEEGKIVFFLTFRQFFWLIGGGVVCFVLYLISPFWLFLASSIFTAILVLIIAFVKINNVSVLRALFDYFRFLAGKKNYIWKKDNK